MQISSKVLDGALYFNLQHYYTIHGGVASLKCDLAIILLQKL